MQNCIWSVKSVDGVVLYNAFIKLMMAWISTSWRPCYTVQFPQKRVSQHGLSRNIFVARCVAQSRTQLYISQRIAASCSTIAQCNTPPATLLAILWQILARAHALSFCFIVPRSIARQVAEKIAECNNASTPNLSNLQRYNFNHCDTSCWENCAV